MNERIALKWTEINMALTKGNQIRITTKNDHQITLVYNIADGGLDDLGRNFGRLIKTTASESVPLVLDAPQIVVD